MAQSKRKTATKTAKKTTARPKQAHRQVATRTKKKQEITNIERMHVYFVTAMAIIAGVLLCADAVMMIV